MFFYNFKIDLKILSLFIVTAVLHHLTLYDNLHRLLNYSFISDFVNNVLECQLMIWTYFTFLKISSLHPYLGTVLELMPS